VTTKFGSKGWALLSSMGLSIVLVSGCNTEEAPPATTPSTATKAPAPTNTPEVKPDAKAPAVTPTPTPEKKKEG